MTLLGFSTYQDRSLRFYARQIVVGNVEFSQKYSRWLLGANVLVGLATMVILTVVPASRRVQAILVLVSALLLVNMAFIPMRFKLWRQWYRNLRPADKAEYWWIKKMGALYALSVPLFLAAFALAVRCLVWIGVLH